MRRHVFALLAALVLLGACTDGGEGSGAQPSPPVADTPSAAPGQDAEAGPGTPSDPPEEDAGIPSEATTEQPRPGEAGRWVRCEDEQGFSLEHPVSWHAQSADGSTGCSQLHPEAVQAPGATDERTAAITVYVDPVAFHEAVALDPHGEVARAQTTIDGLPAVRLEYDMRDDGLYPAGTSVAMYAIDLSPGVDDGPGTLFLDTLDLEPFAYEENRVMLDRIARSLEVTDPEVPRAPELVARYQGGGGGFSVEGSVTEHRTCLRIRPDGDDTCVETPGAAQVRAFELTDLEPVLAGVAGGEVARVTAELRDGGSSTFLPAPIGQTSIRGFAFTFDADAVDRLVAYDAAGLQLAEVRPEG